MTLTDGFVVLFNSIHKLGIFKRIYFQAINSTMDLANLLSPFYDSTSVLYLIKCVYRVSLYTFITFKVAGAIAQQISLHLPYQPAAPGLNPKHIIYTDFNLKLNSDVKRTNINKQRPGREPWSSGYGCRLMFERLWV